MDEDLTMEELKELLYCMGYYGHDDEEDILTDKMSLVALNDYYLEKCNDMDEE